MNEGGVLKLGDLVAQLKGRAQVATERNDQNRDFLFEADLRSREAREAQYEMYRQAGLAQAYDEAAALIEMVLRDA